ncbi:hypothetical protein K469DRAFT_704935 [Zopfia rhizophila CBS 207.26]|uniref:Nuclear speckle splicing regulatory protein 1 N-terminal domain-containing protein n=1 Tax=Zopfia rhizophila CBS 207.26 TaxID=1314779 RepID=A0A6A6E5P1_9PEZI|nr:hypothetical protein K469DRAFT_704935 [Zopfia rhizophila CBS 207.26]
MSLRFGLNIQKKGLNGLNKPASTKKKSIFDNEEEEGEGKAKAADGAEEIAEFDFEERSASTSKPAKHAPSSKLKAIPSGPPTLKSKAKKDDPSSIVGDSASLREAEQKAQEAMELDPSIYDYDAAYDAIHAKSAAKTAAEREDALQRRPKYMDNLFESAEVRKKDQLRARDKILQKEREAEGDEFADKERFVTGAYRAQQEEVRRMEEEEKKRQEEEDQKKQKLGMQGFYRKIMEEDEKRHQEVIEAAAQAGEGGIKPDTEDAEEKTAAEIAKDINEKGGNVILNDEGQVADKRQLLTAGLNIVAKPKSATASTLTSSHSTGPQPAYQGRNPTQRAVRERQTKLIEEQLKQATKRAADEEAEEQRKLEHASKSRKTEGDISSAKERYLQRKREREAAATAPKGS